MLVVHSVATVLWRLTDNGTAKSLNTELPAGTLYYPLKPNDCYWYLDSDHLVYLRVCVIRTTNSSF